MKEKSKAIDMKFIIFVLNILALPFFTFGQVNDTPEAFLSRLKIGLTNDNPSYFEEELNLSKNEARQMYFMGNPDMRWIENEPNNDSGKSILDNFWKENLGLCRNQFNYLWNIDGEEGRRYFEKINFVNVEIDTTITDKIKPEYYKLYGQFGLITADYLSPTNGQQCTIKVPVFKFKGHYWKLYARFVQFGDCSR